MCGSGLCVDLVCGLVVTEGAGVVGDAGVGRFCEEYDYCVDASGVGEV